MPRSGHRVDRGSPIQRTGVDARDGRGCPGRGILPLPLFRGNLPPYAERPGCRSTRVFPRCEDLADDDREDVARGQDEELVRTELDLGAAVLAVEHAVAHGDVERNAVAVVVDATRSDRHDL